MSSQAELGRQAVQNRDYVEAIKQFTAALKQSQAPAWLIERSIAYQRTGSHALALQDAEDAYIIAKQRGKRDLMATSQLRRAIALFGLGRIGDSRLCLTWVGKWNDKEKGWTSYQAQIVGIYENLPEDSEQRKITITEEPDMQKPKASEPVVTKATTVSTLPTTAAATPKEGSLPAKVRHEWFQSVNKVTITIFAKGVPKDKASIEIKDDSFSISFPTAVPGTDFEFALIPLFAKIDPAQSSYSITPNKVEISLHKVVPSKWSALEGTTIPYNVEKSEPAVLQPAPVKDSGAPAYPSSAKNKVTNWDKLDVEEDKEEETADDFFQTLYKNADADTRRAMMKSMVESNGTTLSTDWKDIGSRKVESHPPEGVEEKKWTT